MRRTLTTIAAAMAFAALTTLGALSTGPAAAKDKDDYYARNCINPAGHVRGSCRHAARGSSINGRVISIGGALVQFARNNGQVMTIDEQPLLALGAPLVPGRYYALRGYWAPNGLFYATTITRWGY